MGFTAQLKETLTKKCYTAATVFVDHYLRLKYIHLMTKLTPKRPWKPNKPLNTLPSSTAFHYHCNNGRFADNTFKNSCSAKGQRLTFCGVKAHFQKGIAEKAIRDLKESVPENSFYMHANNG